MLGDPGEPEAESGDVIDMLSDLFIMRGIPSHIRSANGPELVAEAARVDHSGGR